MPNITAVIPTRNRHDLLERAIQSVKDQDPPVHEIIVVDEASEPPVHASVATTVVRHNSPVGPGGARNAGIRHATGEVIAFLDDDDLWLPKKIRRIIDAFERIPDAGVVFHSVSFLPPKAQICEGNSLVTLDDPVKRMLSARPPHPSGLTVTAAALSKIKFDETMPAAADLDFNIRLAESYKVVEIEEVLAVHGSRPPGTTEVDLDRRIAGRLLVRDRYADYFNDPEVIRHHEYRLAHLYRRSGQTSKALASFARLAQTNPLDPRPWKGLVATVFPSFSRVRNR